MQVDFFRYCAFERNVILTSVIMIINVINRAALVSIEL